jgi:hypothetical protein
MFERICRENGIVARNTKPRSPTTTGKVERFHQTLQQELLDHVDVWPDLATAQAAIDVFRHEYNTNRPHQSLHMAFPADRFTPRTTDQAPTPQLPATLPPAAARPHSVAAVTVPPRLSTNGAEPVDLAVEFTRVVPSSGNLAVCGQQFWLGPDRAGGTVTFWADTTVVHLLVNGVRLKTVPSRLTTTHLRWLLDDGGYPAGPPPIRTGTTPVTAIEVDRTVNTVGAVGLAGRQHPVGYHFAGRRVTVRLDHGLLQLIQDGVLLRSLPNPLTPADLARLRDARPAGPPPQPPADALRVQRRISSRGALAVAGQRIHVGMVHAGRTVTVETGDTTWRIYHRDELLTEVARTNTKPIARFKVRKPEPPRAPGSARTATAPAETPSCPAAADPVRPSRAATRLRSATGQQAGQTPVVSGPAR